MTLDELARPQFTLHAGADSVVEVSLAVHGDHQVSNALCAAAVALECGATTEQVAERAGRRGPGVGPPDAGEHPRRRGDRDRRRLQRQPGFDARRAAGAGLDCPSSRGAGRRRSWAVLGEMAELGEDAISEHDRIGRLAVRLDVSRLIVVGIGRSMSAMHHGAVMEGSWGGEAADRRRRRRRPGLAAGRTAARGRGAGQGVQRRRAGGVGRFAGRRQRRRPGRYPMMRYPHRRRHLADGVDPR